MAASAQGAVVLIDIADMGMINDRHGTRVGDRLIRAIERSLRRQFTGATVARLPGDQFAVVMPAVAGGGSPQTQVIETVSSSVVRGRRGEKVWTTAHAGSAAWGVGTAAEQPQSADRAFWAAAGCLAGGKERLGPPRARPRTS